MKLTNSEYTTMCYILENRSYRYSDSQDTTSEEYKMFKNINKRVYASTEGSSQRYTQDQKHYLIEMVSEYKSYNCMQDEVIEDKERYNDCQSIIDKLLK